MHTKEFWHDAIERAIKTFAQTFIALTAVAGPVSGYELLQINWLPVLMVAGIASGISILTSLASTYSGDKNSASLVK